MSDFRPLEVGENLNKLNQQDKGKSIWNSLNFDQEPTSESTTVIRIIVNVNFIMSKQM